MGILSFFRPAPKHRPGVYCITNRRTGHFYIGATTLTITERWNRHCYMLDTGRHHNKRLQADWDAYGSQAFKFSVIEVVQDTDQVFIRQEPKPKELGLAEGIGSHRTTNNE
jgi:group I intron endonuclease